MKQHRSTMAFWWLSTGLLAVAALLTRQRRITRRLAKQNTELSTELDTRDEELNYTVTVQMPGALEALHSRQSDAPPPFRPEIAETDRGRKLKSVIDMIVTSDERYMQRIDQAAKGTLRAAMRRIQSLAAEQQVAISEMEELHDDPKVLEGLLAIDHMNSQLGRRAQAIAVLCGGWPGQQRSASALTDVVRGATSRIRDYLRVHVPIDSDVAVVPRVVEPVVLAVAELLDNAARHSQPGTMVEVTFRQERDGVAIVIDDAGVGMSDEALKKAAQALSGTEDIDIQRLGEPPQVGFAVIGVLAARYGFAASVETIPLDKQSRHGSVRATVFLPNALLTKLDASTTELPAARPRRQAIVRDKATIPSGAKQAMTDTLVGGDSRSTTPGGLPMRRRRGKVHADSSDTSSLSEQQPTAKPPAQERTIEQAAALGAWQRGTRRYDSEGSPQS